MSSEAYSPVKVSPVIPMNDARKFEWLLRLASAFQACPRQQAAQEEAAHLQPSSHSQSLDATIVSSPDKVAELAALMPGLGAKLGMLAPEFFLASFSPQRWRPCVVVVSQEQRIAGLLYCRERVVAGVGTRIAVGDDTLGAMIVADPKEAGSIICCGVKALLKRMVGIRLMVPAHRLPFLTDIQAYADVDFYCAKRHSHMELPRTYDEFLVRLGPDTRRNFRRYRRKSEQIGNEFIEELSFADFCANARHLFPKAAYATTERNLDMWLGMIEAMPSRILVGLRRKDGEWISLVGGWHVDSRAIVNMQLNDRAYGRESVSLVMRSYLIEALINRGLRELVFWKGTSGPLNFCSVYPKVFMTHIDARSTLWRLCRAACRRVNQLAPATLGKWLRERWIVLDGGQVL